MVRRPKRYGKWVLIAWALATVTYLVSFVFWMIDNQPLYRITQLIAAGFSFALIYLAIQYSHQIKMEEIQETLANVRARKKVVPVEDRWLKDTIMPPGTDERDFINTWTADKKED